MKRATFTLLFSCALVCAHAQGTTTGPDLSTTDNAIFDPTRPREKDAYRFAVDYRFELGYVQPNQRSTSYPNLYLHGARVGATFDFLLPYHFVIQTGVLFDVAYGSTNQHWRSLEAASTQEEYLHHRILEWEMNIPVRCYYVIPLWKKLNMFFFTGPEFRVGLIEHDFLERHVSDAAFEWIKNQGIAVEEYDRYSAGELYRLNVQWGLGGGIEWDGYRLQAGYDFGLNNLVKSPVISGQKMNEWGWFVSVAFRL